MILLRFVRDSFMDIPISLNSRNYFAGFTQKLYTVYIGTERGPAPRSRTATFRNLVEKCIMMIGRTLTQNRLVILYTCILEVLGLILCWVIDGHD
jgi:hypothetical protein